ncbi:MAG: hypothetical protein ACYDCL_22530 [Myxococcales bacterium]
MSRKRDDDVEPELTELIAPIGRLPLGEDLTPEGPTPRVAEDASRELGGVALRDEAMDQAPDITPDRIERRSPSEERQETARPASRPLRREED